MPKSVRPDDGRLSWLLGESRKALRSQEPQRALLMLLDAQRIDPNNAKVDNNLCVALIGVHRYDEAIEACNAALQVQDDLKLARNNLAWAKAEQAKVPGARR